MRIALTGNPNSGKTTMYNALTGRNEKIGNWAGVTVDKKEYPVKKDHYDGSLELIAVDLPGAYSMSPFTSEESITSGYVKNEHPDAIINIVDATNLSRSLFFTTQLLELGVPVVVALNKSDINEKKGNKIDEKILSEKLGCPVIKTTSTTDTGLREVVKKAAELQGAGQKPPYVQGDINLHDKKEVEAADRKRFEFVNAIVKQVETRKVLTKEKNVGDKIDANDKAAVEADLNALKEAINKAPIDQMTDAQIDEIKAGKEKLMNSAQALFSKVYEQAQAAGAAGAQGGAQGAADAGSAPHDDNVVDGDFKEV